MRKIFRLTDLVIVLTTALFVWAFIDADNRLDVRIFSIIWSFLLLFSLARSVIDRIKIYRYNVRKNKSESVMDEQYKNYLQLKGKALENLVENELKRIYKKDIIIFRDLSIPSGHDKSIQIDIVAIISNRVIVFECKAYSTRLYGSWDDELLTTDYENTKTIQNPVKQNQYHIKKLSQITIPSSEFYGNIVVFGEDTSYSYDKYPPKLTRVSKVRFLKINVDNLLNNVVPLEDNQVKEIVSELEKYSKSN
jgi:hypothetical protein